MKNQNNGITSQNLHLCYLGKNNVPDGVFHNDLMHKHNVWSLDLCCAGEIRVNLHKTSLRFKQGDVLLIPPNQPHRFLYQGKAFICFSFKFQISGIPDSPYKNFYYDDEEESEDIRKGMIEAVRQCVEAFCPKELLARSHAFAPTQSIHGLTILENFLFGIFCHYTEKKHESQDKQDPFLQKITEYVSSFGGRPVSENEMAKHFHYSPRYFRTLLQKHCKELPKTYIDRVRIQILQEILRYSGWRLKETAFNAGFHDPRYFTRFFKKYTGLTPREWISQNRDK